MNKYLDYPGLVTLWQKIKSCISGKQDTVYTDTDFSGFDADTKIVTGFGSNKLYLNTAARLWTYIQNQISSVLGLSPISYGGNAATATTATNYASGGGIADALAAKSPTTHTHSVKINGVTKTIPATGDTSASGSTASFYAPTGTGTNRRLLRSNGSGEPTWKIPAVDYVFYNQTWSGSGDTHTLWAFRLKGINSSTFDNILLSFNTYFWNDLKSSSDLIWIGWSNNGNKGLVVTSGRLRIKGNDGGATALEYYIVKNKAGTAEACTVDLYIRPASAGNGYGSFYVSVLNSGNRDLDDIIEKKGTYNVDLPEGAIKIPYSGTIGSADTAYSVNATAGNSITSIGTNGSMEILNGALTSLSGVGGSCSIDGDGIGFTSGVYGSSMTAAGIATSGTGTFIEGASAKGRPIDGSVTFVTKSSLTWSANTTHLVVNRSVASTTTIDLKDLTNSLVYWLHVPRDNIIALKNSSALSTFHCYNDSFTTKTTTDTYNIRSNPNDSRHGGFSTAIIRNNTNFYVMMEY